MNRFALYYYYMMNGEPTVTIPRTKSLRFQLELTDWRSYAHVAGWRPTQAKQERLAQAIKSAASTDLKGQ